MASDAFRDMARHRSAGLGTAEADELAENLGHPAAQVTPMIRTGVWRAD
jgi:hypothetical protein